MRFQIKCAEASKTEMPFVSTIKGSLTRYCADVGRIRKEVEAEGAKEEDGRKE